MSCFIVGLITGFFAGAIFMFMTLVTTTIFTGIRDEKRKKETGGG